MYQKRTVLFIVLSLILASLFVKNINCEETADTYLVYDASTNKTIGEYQSEYEAYLAFDQNADQYDNLVLCRNLAVEEMEYGYVVLKGKQEYRSTIYNINRTIDGGNGLEAVYLKSRLGSAYFTISGETGYLDKTLVELVPYEKLSSSASYYMVQEGMLYHLINTAVSTPYHDYQLLLGKAPFGLSDGDYLSYDGHYFYQDFYLMSDDYRKNSHQNAINSEPYYNYYQYLPFASSSNYSAQDINSFIEDTLNIDRRMDSYRDASKDGANDVVNASELYDMGDCFKTVEQADGNNALMLFATAIVDSSYGKNLNAFNNHSLYQGIAYDDENERSNGYQSVADSIANFSHYYVSTTFDNYLKPGYSGTNFGNLVSGFSSGYNGDPYYGEKLVAQYYEFDSRMGFRDLNKEKIAIVSADRLIVYSNPECSDYHYSLKNIHDFGFIVLEEEEKAYKVKLTQSLNFGISYPEGYLLKSDVDYLIGEGHQDDKQYAITFDYDGGLVNGEGSCSYLIREGQLPSSLVPNKEGYEFIGFDKEVEIATCDTAYQAKYLKIDEIRLSSDSIIILEDDIIDISRAFLEVVDENMATRTIPINSDMVSIDNDEAVISYCGLYIKTPLVIRENADTEEMMASFLEDPSSLSVNEVYDLMGKRKTFSFQDIRLLDDYLYQLSDDNYHIYDNAYDISVSGLASSIAKTDDKIFKNCIYLRTREPRWLDDELIRYILDDYFFDYQFAIDISLYCNYEKAEVIAPLIYSVKVAGGKDYQYAVYHFEKGRIEKCYTQWSNGYVHFMSDKTGIFAIMARKSLQEYDFADSYENINAYNNGFDNHRFIRHVLAFSALYFTLLLNFVFYYQMVRKEEKQWKDCRKSLQAVDIVQEEKLKN